MRVHHWSTLILDIEGDDEYSRRTAARFAHHETHPDPDHVPAFPWLAGNPRYADVHEFDRRAVAALIGAHDRDLPARYAARLRTRAYQAGTLIDSRNTLIAEWEGHGDPVTPHPEVGITEEMLLANRLCTRAVEYLHYRGYDVGVFAELADDLWTLLTLYVEADRYQARLDGEDVSDDDLDRALDATRAGMSADEIGAALISGSWPDPDALALMGSLRLPVSGG